MRREERKKENEKKEKEENKKIDEEKKKIDEEKEEKDKKKSRERNMRKEKRERKKMNIFLFNGISTLHGLFNTEIWSIFLKSNSNENYIFIVQLHFFNALFLFVNNHLLAHSCLVSSIPV